MSFRSHLARTDSAVQSTLGDAVTYTPSVGEAVSVNGQYDALYQLADVGEAGVTTSGPAVWLSLVDLPDGADEDMGATVVCEGTTYRVREIRLDGSGGMTLILKE